MNKMEPTEARASDSSSILGATVDEEIRGVLEIMERVRMANAQQAEKALRETLGNKYTLPEAVALKAGGINSD